MNKSAISIVAIVALGAGVLLSWYAHSNKPITLEDGLWFGEQARALPEFELRDHRNNTLNRASLSGHWSLMFFGYVHCPDICPITLQTMNQMVEAIDDSDVHDRLQIVFVSVDPDRDSPDLLANYVGHFNRSFIGATAPMENLRPLTGSLGIAHESHKKSEDDLTYLVDHSGAIVLINPKAEFAGLFSAPHDARTMARDITRIVEYN